MNIWGMWNPDAEMQTATVILFPFFALNCHNFKVSLSFPADYLLHAPPDWWRFLFRPIKHFLHLLPAAYFSSLKWVEPNVIREKFVNQSLRLYVLWSQAVKSCFHFKNTTHQIFIPFAPRNTRTMYTIASSQPIGLPYSFVNMSIIAIFHAVCNTNKQL